MKRVNNGKFLVALFTLCVAATSTAFACKLDTSATFQDDFKKPDPQWLPDGKLVYFADGQLAIKPGAGHSDWRTFPTFTFKNATYCVDVKGPPDVDDHETTAGAGLMFWQNYFVIVYSNGNYAVWRKTPDWVAVLASTKFEKLKAGSNAVNEIKVTTLNNVMTLFFNGEKATELRAQAPKNGGEFGVYAQSSKDNPNEWRFLSIVVNE